MKYRPFGKLDWQASALGFGCMRLPIIGDDSSQIDEELATAMLRYAIDNGVNYVDTAWGYHREKSEPFVGRALKDGYRERVKLATKLPSWLVHSREDMDRLFDAQLEKLQTDHVDLYLLHSLHQAYWDNYQRLKVFDWAEKKMAEGAIKHLGFSFHDEYKVFEEILNGYDNWEFCQIQYNYMDVEHQAGLKGLKAAAEKGLAVVIMEPLRGGNLARRAPDAVAAEFARSERPWNNVEWALHWLWDQPEVSLLLSGMSTMEQVEQNIATASASGIGSLTAEDREIIHKVQEAYRKLEPVPCTHCEYCLPCPNGVAIPTIFEIYNDLIKYDNLKMERFHYKLNVKPEEQANNCVECGQCEELCPQQIEIIKWLEIAHERLGEPTP